MDKTFVMKVKCTVKSGLPTLRAEYIPGKDYEDLTPEQRKWRCVEKTGDTSKYVMYWWGYDGDKDGTSNDGWTPYDSLADLNAEFPDVLMKTPYLCNVIVKADTPVEMVLGRDFSIPPVRAPFGSLILDQWTPVYYNSAREEYTLAKHIELCLWDDCMEDKIVADFRKFRAQFIKPEYAMVKCRYEYDDESEYVRLTNLENILGVDIQDRALEGVHKNADGQYERVICGVTEKGQRIRYLSRCLDRTRETVEERIIEEKKKKDTWPKQISRSHSATFAFDNSILAKNIAIDPDCVPCLDDKDTHWTVAFICTDSDFKNPRIESIGHYHGDKHVCRVWTPLQKFESGDIVFVKFYDFSPSTTYVTSDFRMMINKMHDPVISMYRTDYAVSKDGRSIVSYNVDDVDDVNITELGLNQRKSEDGRYFYAYTSAIIEKAVIGMFHFKEEEKHCFEIREFFPEAVIDRKNKVRYRAEIRYNSATGKTIGGSLEVTRWELDDGKHREQNGWICSGGLGDMYKFIKDFEVDDKRTITASFNNFIEGGKDYTWTTYKVAITINYKDNSVWDVSVRQCDYPCWDDPEFKSGFTAHNLHEYITYIQVAHNKDYPLSEIMSDAQKRALENFKDWQTPRRG